MKRKLLFAVLFLQITVMLCAYLWYQAGLHYPHVMLRVEPVDPRDLLRGDYVIIGYEIGRMPEELADSYKENDTVYVVLKNEGAAAVAQTYQRHRPNPGELYLKGRIQGRRVLFDMEKYFVAEGRGNPPQPWMMKVAIRENGQGQIVQLYSQGNPWR